MLGVIPLFAVVLTTAAPANDLQRIPIRYEKEIVTLPVEVNGKSLRFILDTGSSETALLKEDKALTPEAGVDLKVGPRTWKGVKLHLLDVPALRQSWLKVLDNKVDGILGMDLLRDVAIGLDVKNKALTVFEAGTRKFDSFLGGTAPGAHLTLNSVGHHWSPIRIGDISYLVTYDSGAQWSQANPPTLASIGGKRNLGKVKSADVTGISEVSLYAISEVALCGFKFPFSLYVLEAPQLPLPGYLGMQVLSTVRVVWDFPNARIYCRPSTEGRFAPAPPPEETRDPALSPQGDVLPLQGGKNYLLPGWQAPLHSQEDLQPAPGGGFIVVAKNPTGSPEKVHTSCRFGEDTYLVYEDGSVEIVHKDGTRIRKTLPPPPRQ